MFVNEVFVAGGLPTHTYVARTSLALEEQLTESLAAGHKLLTITGPTKSGKTVLVRKQLSDDKPLWISGGAIGDEAEFWATLAEKLGVYENVETSQESSIDRALTGGATAGLNIGVAKVDLNTGGTRTASEGSGVTYSRTVTPKVAVLSKLEGSSSTLVIDDFHYISREIQAAIIRALKDPIFNGLRVVALAVPHRRYDAVRVEREMTGRVAHVDVPPWTPEELAQIATKGFAALNVTCSETFVAEMTKQAFGSPHLMQDFCRRLCAENGIGQRSDVQRPLSTPTDSAKFFSDLAAHLGRLEFDRLANGPRTRTDRLQREFQDGTKRDIYHAVLRAIAAIDSANMEIPYAEIREGLRSVLKVLPQSNETTRVLEKMAEVAKENKESVPVLDWDADLQKVVITDPFFAFYLRWGDYDS